MMKKSVSETVSEFLKSLGGGGGKKPDDTDNSITKGEEENTTPPNTDDDKNEETENGNGEDDNDDDENFIDGTEILKSLENELSEMRKSREADRELIIDLGKALTGIAQMVHVIGNEKIPMQSVVSKSLNNFEGENPVEQQGRPTEKEFEQVQDILIKSVQNGEIDMQKASMISSDVQHCMASGRTMRPEFYEFLHKKLYSKNKEAK